MNFTSHAAVSRLPAIYTEAPALPKSVFGPALPLFGLEPIPDTGQLEMGNALTVPGGQWRSAITAKTLFSALLQPSLFIENGHAITPDRDLRTPAEPGTLPEGS
jgi:hypothetical protein